MNRAILALMLMIGLAVSSGPSMAQGLSPSDKTEIQGVIGRQLDAFKRDDAAGAYAFAAPNVRQAFPSPDIFMQMVKRGYPSVYRPRDIEFSELALRDGDVIQEVELVGPDGQPILAVYTMVRGASGNWVIAAVSLVPSVRVGT